jgi:hypothetical protein
MDLSTFYKGPERVSPEWTDTPPAELRIDVFAAVVQSLSSRSVQLWNGFNMALEYPLGYAVLSVFAAAKLTFNGRALTRHRFGLVNIRLNSFAGPLVPPRVKMFRAFRRAAISTSLRPCETNRLKTRRPARTLDTGPFTKTRDCSVLRLAPNEQFDQAVKANVKAIEIGTCRTWLATSIDLPDRIQFLTAYNLPARQTSCFPRLRTVEKSNAVRALIKGTGQLRPESLMACM